MFKNKFPIHNVNIALHPYVISIACKIFCSVLSDFITILMKLLLVFVTYEFTIQCQRLLQRKVVMQV